MLDPEYLRRVAEGAEELAGQLHEAIIKIIVEAIVHRLERGDDYLLTARDRWMLEILESAGYLREDLMREIAARTPLMLKEVRAAFKDAAVRSLAWDDAVYIAAGLHPPELRRSPTLMRLVERGYEKTAGEWVNFTGTLADSSQELFIRECDKAYNLVVSGAMGQAQAVRQAVEAAAKDGVVVRYPSGHRDTIETATARAVRTGVGQACGEVTLARMEEMGWDIVLVSAHLGARTGDGGENFTNHFWWQGKFYRRDVELSTIRKAMENPARSAQADTAPGGGEMPPAMEESETSGQVEFTRRKIGKHGQEIIDKPTYNKLTRDFLRRGGIIIRGEEAERHLASTRAYASYIAGGNTAYIKDDATITDVLEEMYHAEQYRKNMFGSVIDKRIVLLREIDAKKYLLNVADKYKIPVDEQDATRLMLNFYEHQLSELEEGETDV